MPGKAWQHKEKLREKAPRIKADAMTTLWA